MASATVIEAHYWTYLSAWHLAFTMENARRYHVNSDTIYAYYYLLDGVSVGVSGDATSLQGFDQSPASEKDTRFEVLPGPLSAGTYNIQVIEHTGHWAPASGKSFPDDFVIDSSSSSNSIDVVVGLPDAPASPIPADGATSVIWNDTLAWTGDTGIGGPFIYRFPFLTSKVDEYFTDSLHTVYFHQTLGSLTDVRHAYNWADDEYELREVNPQYFGFSDYLWMSPYPPYEITLYWQIKTTNEWGTTWGSVWYFTTVPEGSAISLPSFPATRPDDYDPDLIWQPGEWTDPTTYVPGDWGAGYVATGGGRWGQNLVVCGNKKIYYEPHEGV